VLTQDLIFTKKLRIIKTL